MTTPTAGPPPPQGDPPNSPGSFSLRLQKPAQVIILTGVMFTFISFWRTAAVVLCDLASTAYYIGGAVEQAIGPAAPWYILAVMLFSYAVRSVYIESCSLFVRGGVYRVVKEAMGGFLAKLSVSALMFDYILTGPTSGVSAGQYIMGLLLDTVHILNPGIDITDPKRREFVINSGAVLIACVITLYFFWQNLIGIHESSGKALKIMIATTIMAVVIIGWSLVTLVVKGPANPDRPVPSARPDLHKKFDYLTAKEWAELPAEEQGQWRPIEPVDEGSKERLDAGFQYLKEKINQATKRQEDPLGILGWLMPGFANRLREPGHWWSFLGIIGLFIAFGHSILAMSGEETLAQVYREVESPKLPNFKKAAFIVFLYSLGLTATISFLAVILIPDSVRIPVYKDNLIGGLAMNVWGPDIARLGLNAFVVVVGFLILAGAVNTAIIGSNGVLNRVAEDGVLPDWFLKPHPRYGTSYRLLILIVGLQLAVILWSWGDMFILTEAYAFGVVWSFVFKAMAMVVLRFKDRSPREYKVPLNVRVGNVEVPIGLSLIFVILLFTAVLLITFISSEHYHEKRLKGQHHKHLEQFNQESTAEVTSENLGLTKSYRKLVSIRSTQNLFMLQKALAETDPETTGIVVMTAKVQPRDETVYDQPNLDAYDQQLMTAVVELAEKAGKEVKPLIVPTNNPLHAVLKTAKELQAHELIMGASNKYTADEQLEQIAFYWISLHDGQPAPLTVRILSRDRDMYLDLGGGNRIPKISERRARSVAELRAAGVGVDRVLLAHDGSPANSDLFQAVLTMLDPQVFLALLPMVPPGSEPLNGHSVIHLDEERARQIGRELMVVELPSLGGREIVDLSQKEQYDLIIWPLPAESSADQNGKLDERTMYILKHAHCRVLLASTPVIPMDIVDSTPSQV